MASSGKRTVKQDELRRLMRSEKQRLSASRKRVESPFAKYSRSGQLSCALCGVPVKSELLWPTHVLGKQHKEKAALLKGPPEPGPAQAQTAPPPAGKTGPEPGGPAAKRARPGAPALPRDFFEAPGPAPGRSLLPAYEEDEDEEEEDVEEAGGGARPPGPAAPALAHSGSIQKAEAQPRAPERRENTAEALPEGFFDDPEADARVRKVDAPREQLDKEWDEFQRAMRQVSSVSEAIVAEEDEEGRLERQIGEIDEQMECYRRVEALRGRWEAPRGRRAGAGVARGGGDSPGSGGSGSGDEGELRHVLCQDWRAKGALL